jgi:hypothetical protein
VVQAYAQGVYMGPLADGEPFVARSGSQIADPGLGNRMDAEVGLTAVYGDFSLSPKFLYRHPIYDALPSIPAIGISPRTYTDLFYVSKNREAVEGELVACYDPEGSTYFFDWNNDDREGAAFAASLSFLYNFYLGPTDRLNFVADNQGTVYSFNAGLPSVAGTWSLQGRAVVRPLPNLRLIATAVAGEAQSEGDPTQPLANFVGGSLRVALGRLSLNGELYRNYWGSEYWYRQFQEIFPVRAKLGFAYGLKDLSFMGETDRIGLDLLYRSDTSMLAASGSDDQKECIEAQVYVNFSL